MYLYYFCADQRYRGEHSERDSGQDGDGTGCANQPYDRNVIKQVALRGCHA